MNPVPIILSMLTKLEYMQKGLWLSIEGASGIGSPNVLESRPQGKTLEGKSPRKMGNLGFYNRAPNGVKMFSPLRK